MSEYLVADTVGQLIELLKAFGPATTVHSAEPPFDGVQIVIQKPTGSLLLCSLPASWGRVGTDITGLAAGEKMN